MLECTTSPWVSIVPRSRDDTLLFTSMRMANGKSLNTTLRLCLRVWFLVQLWLLLRFISCLTFGMMLWSLWIWTRIQPNMPSLLCFSQRSLIFPEPTSNWSRITMMLSPFLMQIRERVTTTVNPDRVSYWNSSWVNNCCKNDSFCINSTPLTNQDNTANKNLPNQCINYLLPILPSKQWEFLPAKSVSCNFSYVMQSKCQYIISNQKSTIWDTGWVVYFPNHFG